VHTAELVYPAALALVLAAMASLTRFVRVASESMAPTLLVDDRLLVIRRSVLTRRFPARGQIVLFRSDGKGRPGRSGRHEVIKRVSATGGDSVLVGDGFPAEGMAENASRPRRQGRLADLKRVEVPAGGIFVLGDNRRVSRDSREYGSIDARQVTGRALLVVWPPRRVRVVR